MKKRTFRFTQLDKKEADQANRAIDDLFKYKPEMVIHSSQVGLHKFKGFQEIEHGIAEIVISATGEGNPTSQDFSVPFHVKYAEILNIQLEPIVDSGTFNLELTSYTASSFSVNVSAASGLGSKKKFFWTIIASREGVKGNG